MYYRVILCSRNRRCMNTDVIFLAWSLAYIGFSLNFLLDNMFVLPTAMFHTNQINLKSFVQLA